MRTAAANRAGARANRPANARLCGVGEIVQAGGGEGLQIQQHRVSHQNHLAGGRAGVMNSAMLEITAKVRMKLSRLILNRRVNGLAARIRDRS